MKKRFIVGSSIAVLVLTLVASPVLAAFYSGTPSPSLTPVFGTLVDFDDQATGTLVNSDDYASVGVTSITETEGLGTFARYSGTQSQPNYVGTGLSGNRTSDTSGGPDGWDGTILIELAYPSDMIGIGVANDRGGPETVTIYDAEMTQLESETVPAGLNVYVYFDRGSRDITYLEITGDFFAIDDLQFNPAIIVEKQILDSSNVADPEDTVINVNEDWEFLMEITVINDSGEDLTDILVKDNFGGDLELLEVNEEEVDQPENKKDTWTGSGTAENVSVLWTGKTLKAHMDWLISSLDNGASATLTVLVSTDINPGQKDKNLPKNEYTEAGEHCLNSGPTAYVVINDYELSYTGNKICVTVEPVIE